MSINRDDFADKVVKAVAARAGWRCSFEGCDRLTIGPSDEGPDRSTNIGEAAHICAAASGPGARRYDASQTPEERSGIGNAIWLCAVHAKLIDRDEATYTVETLHAMKDAHEARCALAVRSGEKAFSPGDLVAIGPDVICTAELAEIASASWTLRLGHFIVGDKRTLVRLVDNFDSLKQDNRYVLSNELGDGRVLASAPTLKTDNGSISMICLVEPRAPRVSVQNTGRDIAFELKPDKNGDIATVEGLDALPQRLRAALAIQRGEHFFEPDYGSRLKEYFQTYRGSPWLDLLFKLDVVRQAAIPRRAGASLRTPLACVTEVRDVRILADAPTGDRLPVRLELEVQGLGTWHQEVEIFMPLPASEKS